MQCSFSFFLPSWAWRLSCTSWRGGEWRLLRRPGPCWVARTRWRCTSRCTTRNPPRSRHARRTRECCFRPGRQRPRSGSSRCCKRTNEPEFDEKKCFTEFIFQSNIKTAKFSENLLNNSKTNLKKKKTFTGVLFPFLCAWKFPASLCEKLTKCFATKLKINGKNKAFKKKKKI